MKALLFSVVLAVTIFLASAEPCYNYDALMASEGGSCKACKADPAKPKVDMCVYKSWGITDADGNVDVEKLKAVYQKDLHKDKKQAVMDVLKKCGTDVTGPLKESKDILPLWECADNAVIEVCPEYEEFLKKWEADPELAQCYGEE